MIEQTIVSAVTEKPYLRRFGVSFPVDATDGTKTLESDNTFSAVVYSPEVPLTSGQPTLETSAFFSELIKEGESCEVFQSIGSRVYWTQHQVAHFCAYYYDALVDERLAFFCFEVEGGLIVVHLELMDVKPSANVMASCFLNKEDEIYVISLLPSL